MLQINDPETELKTVPLFRLAFRSFFLFGALFSCLALFLWGLNLMNATGGWQPYGGWFWWHGHEMLYGFTVAIITGFLLTAVQTWTGIPGLSGWPLVSLFVLWQAGRIAMLFPLNMISASLDIALLPVVAMVLSRPVIKIRQWRNLVFVPILFVLAWCNGMAHYRLWQGNSFPMADFQTAILLITLIILVVGGRVIPFFTANATGTQKPMPIMALEIAALGSFSLIVLWSLIGSSIEANKIVGCLYLIAAASHLTRFSRWRFWLTFDNPLLWSLHLAYLFITVSMALMAGYHFELGIGWSTALHGFNLGGMGLMVLAMISRVSLGHTGRKLSVRPVVTAAFVALLIAGLLRIFAPLLFGQNNLFVLGSIAFWLFGFLVFVGVYWPILTSPRPDGRPG